MDPLKSSTEEIHKYQDQCVGYASKCPQDVIWTESSQWPTQNDDQKKPAVQLEIKFDESMICGSLPRGIIRKVISPQNLILYPEYYYSFPQQKRMRAAARMFKSTCFPKETELFNQQVNPYRRHWSATGVETYDSRDIEIIHTWREMGLHRTHLQWTLLNRNNWRCTATAGRLSHFLRAKRQLESILENCSDEEG